MKQSKDLQGKTSVQSGSFNPKDAPKDSSSKSVNKEALAPAPKASNALDKLFGDVKEMKSFSEGVEAPQKDLKHPGAGEQGKTHRVG